MIILHSFVLTIFLFFFFFSSRRRHTRLVSDWSSDVALPISIAFGVPGSTAMAILLGGFFLLGLVPGPDMLTKHLPLTFSMVWTIVIANIVTVLICFLFLNRLAGLTNVRGGLLIPVILVLVFIGSY